MASPVHFGVDIGGTKTLAVALDDSGALLGQARLATGRGARGVIDTAEAAVLQVARTLGLNLVEAASVGVGVPGRVDSATGTVRHAVNLGFDSLDLGAQLSARLGTRVHVENDVNAAALGTYHRVHDGLDNNHPYDRSMAYLNLGTGLAAGIVVGGHLRRGARGTAGEIGHIPVDPTGELCPCGQRGCLEISASGSAIARRWPTTAASPVHSLKNAVDAGDATAIEVWSDLLDGVASAVNVLVLTVDVDTVVIGGGVASIGEPLLGGVQVRLAERAAASPFIASLELTERVRLVPEGVPAAAIGAAFVARDAAELEDAA